MVQSKRVARGPLCDSSLDPGMRAQTMTKTTTTAPESATPTTWGEYFHARRIAQLVIGEALAAYKEAGRVLDECTQQKDALEAWARKAEKVKPYTGELMRDDAVTLDRGADS